MEFDPYHKWLGIPPSEQPPDHYRLLGISRFESDPEVIDAAANRQMAYLHGFANSEHAATSQRLLNEVAAARLCLLNATTKLAYDARLEQETARERQGEPRGSSPVRQESRRDDTSPRGRATGTPDQARPARPMPVERPMSRRGSRRSEPQGSVQRSPRPGDQPTGDELGHRSARMVPRRHRWTPHAILVFALVSVISILLLASSRWGRRPAAPVQAVQDSMSTRPADTDSQALLSPPSAAAAPGERPAIRTEADPAPSPSITPVPAQSSRESGVAPTRVVREVADVPDRDSPPTSGSSPEALRLDELNTPAWDGDPWLSPDGLTIYWASASDVGLRIWTASRKNPGSPFEGKRLICKGQNPTVTGDGKQLFFIDSRTGGKKGFSIFVAKRASTEADFDRPREVAEFRPYRRAFSPSISPDGLTITFVSGREGARLRIMESRRHSADSPWETPTPLPISVPGHLDGDLEYPYLTTDRLTMYCCLDRVRDGRQKSELLAWARDSAVRPFARFESLTLPGALRTDHAVNFSPRYVESTNELFLCSLSPSPGGYMDLWMVRNFKPIPARSPRRAEPVLRDLGSFSLTKTGRSWAVVMPDRFTKAEVAFYRGDPGDQTLNAAWEGHLQINGRDAVRFKGSPDKGVFLFHDYTTGADYEEMNDYRRKAPERLLDVTELLHPGENSFFYYHEQRPDLPMGLVLYITGGGEVASLRSTSPTALMTMPSGASTVAKAEAGGAAGTYLVDLPRAGLVEHNGWWSDQGMLVLGGLSGNPIARKPLMFDGRHSLHGIYQHARPSGEAVITYRLGRRFDRFRSEVVIPEMFDHQGHPRTPLVFKIVGDGRLIWRSRPLAKKADRQPCSVSVKGVDELSLRVECRGPENWGLAAWIDPQLSASGVALQDGAALPTRPINLMTLLDPRRDSVGGEWGAQRDGLVSPEGGSVIKIPYRPPEEYRLKIRLVKGSRRMVGIGLVTAPGQVLIAFDTFPDEGCLSKFDVVDGRGIVFHSGARVLPLFKTSTVVCTVRKGSVTVESNGRHVGRWEGDCRRLSVHPEWTYGGPGLFICSVGSGTVIRGIELEPLAKEADSPRTANPQPSTGQSRIQGGG